MMNKINNKSIVFVAKVLSVLMFSLLMVPTALASTDGINYVYNTYTPPPQVDKAPEDNPTPSVASIIPKSALKGSGARTVTVVGDGFVPSSVARVNGFNRNTTFIDSSHLLVQLNGNDMYTNEGLYVTVFNGAPAGGYSNAGYFALTTPVNSNSNTNGNSGNTTNNNNNPNNNQNNPNNSQNTTDQNGNTTSTNPSDSNYNSLASNAIFGSNGFMPTGLLQWVMLAIVILIIVILARRVFGGKKNYENSPLKHA